MRSLFLIYMIYQFKSAAVRRFGVFTLALFTSLFLYACQAPKAAQQDSDTLPNALLWKIEGNGISQPSYLFGTIHMIPKDDYFLPTGLEDAFNKTNKVVFEIDMDEMSDMNSMMSLLSNLMMNDGMTLSKLLTPDEYKEVSDYFEDLGLPMFLLGKVKPMFLSMLAEVSMDPSSMDSEEIVSYEMELFDKANSASKPVDGLETMDYQVSLFDSIPYKEQATMLLEVIRGTQMESDMLDETVKLYKLQDIEAMVEMVSESTSADNSNFENILLNNRNRNWIPVMEKKMSKGPVFFAVGAGHLGGENGVIRLLQHSGYKLSPVSVYNSRSTKKI